MSHILRNSFPGDNNLVSIAWDRTTWESYSLCFMAANFSWGDTNLKAHDSLNGPV